MAAPTTPDRRRADERLRARRRGRVRAALRPPPGGAVPLRPAPARHAPWRRRPTRCSRTPGSRVVHARERWEPQGATFRTWLFTLAHHRVIDLLRRSGREVALDAFEGDGDEPWQPEADGLAALAGAGRRRAAGRRPRVLAARRREAARLPRAAAAAAAQRLPPPSRRRPRARRGRARARGRLRDREDAAALRDDASCAPAWAPTSSRCSREGRDERPTGSPPPRSASLAGARRLAARGAAPCADASASPPAVDQRRHPRRGPRRAAATGAAADAPRRRRSPFDRLLAFWSWLARPPVAGGLRRASWPRPWSA